MGHIKTQRQIFYEHDLTRFHKDLTPSERKVVAWLADQAGIVLYIVAVEEFQKRFIFSYHVKREAFNSEVIQEIEKIASSFEINIEKRDIIVNRGLGGGTLR